MTTERAVERIEFIREEVEKKISGLPPLMQDRTSLHSIRQALEVAAKALRNQQEPKWIPVTERLPEEGDRYLCRLKSFAFPGSFYQLILRYDKYGFNDGGVCEEGVTHWMPLPKPPKEG